MGLSNDLISQFVKVTKDEEKKKSESIVYGTIVDRGNDLYYVQIDGSDEYTPIITTANVKAKERVTVMIKNHTATVIGNISDPSASSSDFETSNNKMTNVIASKLSYEDANITYATIENLNATNAEITSVKTEYLKSEDAAIKYASIDFSNISNSTMESFYANSGLIKDVVIGSGTITGSLAGVTIKGDLIESSTIVADKLLLKGEDGLYYKLNTDGVKTESEQTEYNSLNGDIFMANSIAATKISVSDLVAFDATIGGFNITDNSIYSGVKQSVVNATRGIYMDKNGQIAFGDASKYIRFFKDTDNRYKLLISGAVTANENFKILEDGSMDAINGSFRGTINADNGTIGGINISGGELSSISLDSDNIPTGFELKSDGSFTSKGGANHDYVRTLEIKSGAIYCSSFYSPSGSFGSGTIFNANGIYFKEGDSSGQTIGSVYQDLDGTLCLRSTNGNIVLNANKLVQIQNGLKTSKLIGGYYQSTAYEGQGSAGYLNIAEIKLTNNYQNSLIELKILRRGDNYVTKIYIRFVNSSGTDPDLAIFDVSNSGVKAYIAKTGTATWNLYIQKSDSHDNVSVLSCHYNGSYMGSEVVTYKNAFTSSLPSGYVTSGYASGFSGYHYSQVYGFHESPSFMRGRSGDGGFDFYFKENGMRIVFDGTNGKIWRVDTSGTWTAIAGDASKILEDIENGTY